MKKNHTIIKLIAIVLLLCLSSCASPPQGPLEGRTLLYSANGDSDLLQRYVPVFVIDDPGDDYNKIGTPVARIINEKELISVDSDRATIYTSLRKFSTGKAQYTNLFYRIHFAGVPYGLFPFYLGSGDNVGLMVIVTLNRHGEPVLYTMVHTCGCYLSFITTSYMAEESWMTGWQQGRQDVYSENLPTHLDFSTGNNDEKLLVIHLRSATHRVKNVWLSTVGELERFKMIRAQLQPFESLDRLVLANGGKTSFYETEGSRKGYVKGSQKIWERLLISWWAFDWRVGEDKKLGKDLNDGIVFYTSLQPWARNQSDLRDFAGFLRYWGWRL